MGVYQHALSAQAHKKPLVMNVFKDSFQLFTGDLISNSEALTFISYYPVPILHILTKCHGLQAGTSLLLLL